MDGNESKKSFLMNLRNWIGLKNKSTLKETFEEVLEEQEAAGEIIDDDKKSMILNVLNFSELMVEDVMIPRADIIAVDYQIKLEDLQKLITDKVHTRMPVYKETLDGVLGFLHIKDMMQFLARGDNEAFNIDTILRECLFVPQSMLISTLLFKMQVQRTHMALVVDEYGGTAGLVTMEDIVEEIVGEIEDEHDVEDRLRFTLIGTNLYEASARISIEEMESNLGVELPDDIDREDFDSIGGLIFALLGRIPVKGEVIMTSNEQMEFEILDADARRIKRVKIRILNTNEDEN